MSDLKRKRAPNWLPSEKYLLLELVEKHFGVVENKKTDCVTMKQKLAEWLIISNEYNSQTTYCSRSADNLKNQWENMKKNAKKEESYNRLHRIQTGGGPANIKKEDQLHCIIISLIKTSAIGLLNPFDSDCVAPGNPENNIFIASENILPESEALNNDFKAKSDENEIIQLESNEAVNQDWSDYTPKLLRTPLSTSLQLNRDEEQNKNKRKSWISRRRPTNTVSTTLLEKLHCKKMEALDFQMSAAEKELSILKESHEVDMQIKKEQLRQEKLKSHILLLDLKLKKKELQNIQ